MKEVLERRIIEVVGGRGEEGEDEEEAKADICVPCYCLLLYVIVCYFIEQSNATVRDI